MQIINIKNGFESGLYDCAIAIGNFDGVHKGHQEIINKVKDIGYKERKPAGILTFEPNPLAYFTKNENFYLTNFEQKCRIIEAMELDFVAYAEFNENFSEISAQDFITEILVKKMKVKHVFTGDDFHFGNKTKGQGNKDMLTEFSTKSGFIYTPVARINDEKGERYSSTRARFFISRGQLPEAEEILGRKFAIEGKVLEGEKIAAEMLGHPTANVDMAGYICPEKGVYKCEVELEGKRYKAIANIGIKPTFKNKNVTKPLLEVHLLDFKGDDFYEKTISVELEYMIRKELKFDSIQDLKQQIKRDINSVQ